MKIHLLIAVSILLITSVSAQLIIDPLSIVVKVEEPKTFQITLNNTHNFTISNFTFDNLPYFTFPEIILEPSQVNTYNFTVDMHESHFGTIQSKVKFKYYVNLQEQITTHHINITKLSRFDPNFITIGNGDTVTWTNRDDIDHTITFGTFDYEVGVNDSVSHIFENIEVINCQLLWNHIGGTIKVINRTKPQQIQNPNYDINWDIDLTSVLNPTTLEVDTAESSFEVGATEYTEGMLKIENTGNETAERIELTSSIKWAVFEFNNFSLEIGKIKWVRFTISPVVFNTTETDKSYSIDIKAKASNSEEHSTNINVFIPYEDLTIRQEDPLFLLSLIEDFCRNNPRNAFCNNTESGEDIIIYRDPEISLNLTVTEFYNLLKRIQRMEDTFQRTTNQQNEDSGIMTSSQTRMESMLNQSLISQEEYKQKSESSIIAGWIIGISIFLTLAFIFIMFFVSKYKSKQSIVEGYTPKY